MSGIETLSDDKILMAQSQLKEYKQRVRDEAEKFIKTTINMRIVQLNEVVDKLMRNQDWSKIPQDVNITVPVTEHSSSRPKLRASRSRHHYSRTSSHVSAAIPMIQHNGLVSTNSKISETLQLIKPHILHLIGDSVTLKMWLTFMAPQMYSTKIDATIQKEILDDIKNLEQIGYCFFKYTSSCFTSRADVVSHVSKFPHIDDFRKALNELDELTYHSLSKMVCQIRNLYGYLHDVIRKNEDRLKELKEIEVAMNSI